jgi:DNA-binding NtrC family response regulator
MKMSLRVLVVEDDMDLLFLYEKALTQGGIEVVTSGNATTAIALLSREKFDIIILDLNLPDAYGTVVIDHIQEDNRHTVKQVVIITANDRWTEDIEKRGVAHILVKPVSMAQIVQLIKRIAMPSN